MAKDALGHGSEGRGGDQSAHAQGVQAVATGPTVVVHHHPDYDEYRVPNPGEKGKGAGYFTNDKRDAIDTARSIHGQNANIVFRSKRYETI